MRFVCPTCRRSFDAAGPCPFDRTQLVDAVAVDQPTQPDTLRVLSATESSTDALATLRRARGSSLYDALIGHTLDGRYYIDRKIGEGGMGVVYAARHAVIERPLAIKVLKREVTRDPATIQRFVQEAKAASRIGHPNIIDVTDFGTTPDGMTYAVMELVVGETLKQTLREQAPLPPLRAIKIAAQLARALGAAHDKGIVHRDLKPENVFLVEREGRTDFVKIVDFGIAKVSPLEGSDAGPRLTRAGSVFGTPEYMAPEQAAGKSDTDHRVDVYALGVILYEMVTGKVPLKGESTVQTLAMQMLDAPMPPSQVRPDLELRPELEAVIMQALAKRREDRFPDMGALLTALEKTHAVIGQSITGSPIYALVPPPTRAKTPTSRVKGEPEFVTTTERPTFDAVYDEPLVPARRSSWPLVVFPGLALAGIGAAIVVYALRHTGDEPPPDARRVAVVAVDARAPEPPVDAAVVIEPPADAAEPVDAAPARHDAGPRVRPPRDAAPSGPVTTPNGRGTIAIQVVTKPAGAQLYAGTTYRGPSGVTLEEPYGTKLALHCRQKGYKEGTVELAFDGETEVAICVMKRIKICIDNVKNPFDDCEPDPTKTP